MSLSGFFSSRTPWQTWDLATTVHLNIEFYIFSIFGHSKITPNSMTLASLPIRCFGHHVLAEISVHLQALSWEFELYIFLGTSFRPTAQPRRLYILHTFYRNPTWLCETCQTLLFPSAAYSATELGQSCQADCD